MKPAAGARVVTVTWIPPDVSRSVEVLRLLGEVLFNTSTTSVQLPVSGPTSEVDPSETPGVGPALER